LRGAYFYRKGGEEACEGRVSEEGAGRRRKGRGKVGQNHAGTFFLHFELWP